MTAASASEHQGATETSSENVTLRISITGLFFTR
jgi:hypothetical protein